MVVSYIAAEEDQEEGCHMHCRLCGDIHGLYPLGAPGGDTQKLYQVFSNVPSGAVEWNYLLLRIQLEMDDGKDNQFFLKICDTGF